MAVGQLLLANKVKMTDHYMTWKERHCHTRCIYCRHYDNEWMRTHPELWWRCYECDVHQRDARASFQRVVKRGEIVYDLV
eukprot:SAG22_NODE_4075_length_1395_cov_0.879630_1_plen_80_part_00